MFLITYFVKHFNVSRSAIKASSEKPAVTSWISWGNGVCPATISMRIWVAQSVVWYVDIMMPTITKSGSVGRTVIHCILLICVLSQFDRIISIVVVKREQESFTGWRVTARTWKEHESLTILVISVKPETDIYRNHMVLRVLIDRTSTTTKINIQREDRICWQTVYFALRVIEWFSIASRR